jgi:uncharacterized protein YciI
VFSLQHHAFIMNKLFYVLHLLPLRKDFAVTMTDDERSVMLQHIEYWKQLMQQGKVYAFGPVMHPDGVYGLGIVSVENEEELKRILDADPAGKINRYEFFPMKAVVPGLKPD